MNIESMPESLQRPMEVMGLFGGGGDGKDNKADDRDKNRGVMPDGYTDKDRKKDSGGPGNAPKGRDFGYGRKGRNMPPGITEFDDR